MIPRQLLRLATPLLLMLVLAGAAAGATHTTSQSMKVVLTKHGPRLEGPTQWRPGVVRIDASSQLPDQEITLLRFRPGYAYADFLADGRMARGHGPGARAAIKRVFAHTIFAGGLDLFRGQSASYAVSVGSGTYYLGEMTTRPQLTAIHVAGTAGGPPTHSSARITATDNRYRVYGNLPAGGTITFANASNRPARLNLIPVEQDTTRAQVLAYIRKHGVGENAPPPPFALRGPQIGTADLSPHRRMQLAYRLPPGAYALVDFDPDLRTGRPEALEGMVAVVTLR